MTSLPAAVLWDLDGTLIDTEPYWIRCEKELVATFGGRWTDADARSIVGFDLLDAAEVIRNRGGVPLRPQEIVDRLMDGVVAQLRESVPWRPGARELLASLNVNRVPCALVTMSWKRLTDEVLPRLPPGSFDAVITGDMVMNGKPHPEPYRRAAEALGVDPLSCIAIEDSPTGITSAERAGCVVVAVPNLVPIPPARHRVLLTTLRGITPEQLGEWVETTPPPIEVQPPPDDDRPGRQRAPEPTPPRFSPIRALGGRGVFSGRRRLLAAMAAVLVLLAGGVWYFGIRDTTPPYRPGAFNVHAWAPYWTLDESLDAIDDRANVFHQISPFWYHARGVTIIDIDTQADEEATDEFIDEAHSRGIPVVPSISDDTASGVMAAVLADPAERAAHVNTIAEFAAAHDFDGVDINYEKFAFADGRSTWAATRPSWVAFITELGARLHADGRVLTVSVPPVYDAGRTDDSGYWVYDYGAIAPHVDAIRIMAYDFSTSTPGPIAPRPWVEEIIAGSTDAAGGPDKLVLGIPLFGYNWLVGTSGTCPDNAAGEREAQTLDNVDERIVQRNATPVYDEVTAEWSFTYDVTFEDGSDSCVQSREVHYIDAAGAQLRMQMSVDAGMLGIALFAFGYDDDALWTGIAEINASLESTIPAAGEAPVPTAPPATISPTTTA